MTLTTNTLQRGNGVKRHPNGMLPPLKKGD